MAKKRHPKARANSNNQRSFLNPVFDRELLEDDFRYLYDTIWTRLLKHSPGDRDDVNKMQATVRTCMLGWNIATDCETPKDIDKVVSELAARSNCNFESPEVTILLVTAKLKIALFPDDDVPIKDAGLTIIKGNPQAWVEFILEGAGPE